MRTKIFLFLAVLLSAAGHTMGQNLTREQYIEKYKDIAISQMHKHKIPASITLAQACLESNNGNSTLARKSNNHFGIKCHDSWKGKRFKHDDDSKKECFRKYKKVKDSFTDHSYFLISGSRYNSLFDLKITDYKAWAHGLKAAGYATNPKYAYLLIDIIEKHQLYKYDTGNARKQSKSDKKSDEKAARKEKKLQKLENKAAKAKAKSKKADARLNKFKAKNSFEVVGTPKAGIVYTVKAGDTLYSIARRYGTTVDSILKLNTALKATELKIGTEIIVRQ